MARTPISTTECARPQIRRRHTRSSSDTCSQAAAIPQTAATSCFSTAMKGPIMNRLNYLGFLLAFLLAAFGAQVSNAVPGPVLTTLLSKELRDLPGKEMLAITVEYPPGGADPIHRHDAHVFVYVLEGSIVMGLRGGTEVTLTRGQTFYEGPLDVHTVSRNASSTKPAKFIVVFVKDKGPDAVLPAR